MATWSFLVLLGAGVALLAGRGMFRQRQQDAAASAAGLSPVPDLRHLPSALQRTALWSLCDGGFEERVSHGVLSRDAHDIEVTAFDLETLRERRGEWAYLPVEPPFRIGAVVSVVACEVDRAFPHLLLKRAGVGDELLADTVVDRAANVAKAVRAAYGVAQSYPAELPSTLQRRSIEAALPEGWRAYGDEALLHEMLAAGLGTALAQAGRRDLVVELLESLIVVYPAARDVVGSDAFADLTSTAVEIADGVLASSRSQSPRGVEAGRVGPRPETD